MYYWMDDDKLERFSAIARHLAALTDPDCPAAAIRTGLHCALGDLHSLIADTQAGYRERAPAPVRNWDRDAPCDPLGMFGVTDAEAAKIAADEARDA